MVSQGQIQCHILPPGGILISLSVQIIGCHQLTGGINVGDESGIADLKRAIRDLDSYLDRERKAYDREHGSGAFNRLMAGDSPPWLEEELDDAL
jgi:hypothetical protein